MKILAYPNKLVSGHKVRNYIGHLNYSLTHDPNESDIDIAIHWDYMNISSISDEVKNIGVPIINRELLNVKKDHVNNIFQRTFGYSLFLDPTTFNGYAVRKSTRQAVHDAIIIKCPIKDEDYLKRPHDEKRVTFGNIKHTYTYQKLIDNRIFDTGNIMRKQNVQWLRDHRVLIVDGKIVCVIFKDKNTKNMFEPLIFGKTPDRQEIRDTLLIKGSYTFDIKSVFSYTEQQEIINFCKMAGVELADLDILRDNSTGLIYVIDINNIAANTIFAKLGNEGKADVIERVSLAFDKMLKSKIENNG